MLCLTTGMDLASSKPKPIPVAPINPTDLGYGWIL